MKHTDRHELVDCPACNGEGGEHAPTNGLFGSGSYEEWFPCQACASDGRVQRVDRLAWLIGEARREDAALALHAAMLVAQKNPPAWRRTMPVTARVGVMAAV